MKYRNVCLSDDIMNATQVLINKHETAKIRTNKTPDFLFLKIIWLALEMASKIALVNDFLLFVII